MVEGTDAGPLPLRERKRALTRQAILAAAERLFEERGFDNVTVAQIADAANVSVKTLFVYFRSKEDLVFTDTRLIEQCLAALRERRPDISPAEAVTQTLVADLDEGGQPVSEGIEGFHRGYADSPSLHSRLLRMWGEYEDRITAALAEQAGTAATPALRLEAIQIVGILRTLTAPEIRTAIAGLSPADALTYVRDWLLDAGRTIATQVPAGP